MRVLLLGAGRIGALHAAHLGADARVAEVLVVDPDPVREAAVRRRCRRARPVRGLEEALERGVDAAVVATPSECHFADVSRLLEAEVAVFCEKPLALTVEDVAALEARAAGGTLMVGFQRRFDDGYRRLEEACAAARERGCPPTLYRLATGDPEPPPADYLALAGSIYHDMLIHDFDVLGFLNPEPPVAVSARGTSAALDDGAPGWGTAVAVCEFADSSLAIVTGSRRTGGGYDVSAQVTAACGAFTLGLADARAAYAHLDRPAVGSAPRWPGFVERFRDAYRRELAHFLDVVEGEPLRGAGPGDMLRALRLADAAERSAGSLGRAEIVASDADVLPQAAVGAGFGGDPVETLTTAPEQV